ncbi:MAG: tetratricopeptide repeat protein [Pseudomonadota bacterium]
MKSTGTIKYNPAFLTEKELIQAFVVRHNDFELILEAIRESQENSSQHILVVAPRGAGKTTLVLRVASEIRLNNVFADKWYPVVFSEESYEVCSPGEFWLQALFRIGEQTRKKRWKKAYEDLHKETDEERLRERALSQLMDFADQKKKRLLLVVENLNMLLGQQITPDDAWKLRHTLLNEPRIMLVGTATTRFDQLDNSGNAMFELFKIHDLKPLDTEECRTLWESITGKRPSLNRIKPIQILTGGSPRLLVIISSFAAKKSFRELMENLTQLVDEHTEYFKSHLDNLPALERKVFVTLADIWRPATARELAESARIDVNKSSAYLQRLISKGAVVVYDQKGRRKWYQLAERMYNIYHLMRRRGEPSNRVRAVVDFMVHFYVDEDLVHLTKNVIDEACRLDPGICTDHFQLIAEILKKPQVEKFREKIIESIPDHIFETLKLGEPQDRQVPGEEQETEVKQKELTKKEIETGILKQPDNPRALTLLALELMINHPDRIEEAKAAFEKATRIDSNYIVAWESLGCLLHYKLKDFIKAEETYRRAIEIDPKNVTVWVNLGILLKDGFNRFEEAAETYRRAIDINPEHAPAWNSLGFLLTDKLGRHEEAEKAYRRAIEIDPKLIFAWGNLGNLLSYKLNRYEEAEEAFRRIIEIDPEDVRGWNSLGHLLSNKLDRHEEAEEAYNRSIEIKPTVSSGWKNLIKCQFESLKNPERALETAARFLEVSGRTAQSLNTLAWLFFENGYDTHFEHAEAWSKEAVGKDQEKPEYQHTLAAMLGGLGKWDESLKIARQFLNDKDFLKKGLGEITDYFINAAGAGYAGKAIKILEQSPDIQALEPVVVGLKIFLGEEILTAREIKEIGEDVAKRIRERIDTKK